MAPDRKAERLLAEGVALHRAGQPAAAIPIYRKVLARDPRHAEATGLLGLAALQTGDRPAAIRLLGEATRLAPDIARHHANLGVALNAAGQSEAAVQSFTRAIEIEPGYAEAYTNRGMALKLLGRAEAAADDHRRAIALRPGEAGFHHNLGNALSDLGELGAAEAAYRRALELRPGYANALSGLARTLMEQGRSAEAVAAGEAAVASQPRNPEHLRHLARAYRQAGRSDAEAASYRRALDADPLDTESWRLLSLAEAKAAPDADLDALERLWADDAIDGARRVHAGLALARWLEDLGAFERAFDTYAAANRLQRALVEWPAAQAKAELDLAARLFDPESAPAPLDPAREPGPIFIVGLPRAGKTTLEGMITRHSRVRAMGELRTLPVLARQLYETYGLADPGGHISAVPPGALDELGARYLESARAIVPEPFIPVDTLPPNFRFAGLLRLALPNARVIHAVRAPVDHCAAIFRQFFSRPGYEFSYDLAELVAYRAACATLMEHWRRAIPGFVLDVDVAELRSDPQAGMRSMLDFCGLGFEPGCAEPHESEPRRFADRLPPADPAARLAPWRRALEPLLREASAPQ